MNSIDLFSANVPFLKPLKTLENQWFSDIFREENLVKIDF